ncbi:hypothetical protein ACIBSV_46315 [Embleya sp. NPDC050154]|uniref:hypothetical protein n=1 Tax=Embleya sp. NPDC050154 TaxID=3363988 RepID=UPI003794FA5D
MSRTLSRSAPADAVVERSRRIKLLHEIEAEMTAAARREVIAARSRRGVAGAQGPDDGDHDDANLCRPASATGSIRTMVRLISA